MAITAHIAIGMALGRKTAEVVQAERTTGWLLGFAGLAFLPDIDFIWSAHLPYGLEAYPPFSIFSSEVSMLSTWGHRGATHSVGFAFIIAILSAFWFKKHQLPCFKPILLVFFAVLSHSILDMMSWMVLLTWPFEDLIHVFNRWPTIFNVESNRVEFVWQPIDFSSLTTQLITEMLYFSPCFLYAFRPTQAHR